MTPDSAVMVHCDTCPDCARVTTLLRDREYETATLLNGLAPMSNPVAIAEQSVITSKRRRLGRVAVIISGAALVATIWIAASLTIIPALNVADARRVTRLGTETISLTCLSPQQAADIINPYVRSDGSAYYIPTTGISAITVRATWVELAKVRNLLHDFDGNPKAACHFPGGSPLNKDQASLLKADRGAAPALAPDKATTPRKTR
jgi:hypothetical protein